MFISNVKSVADKSLKVSTKVRWCGRKSLTNYSKRVKNKRKKYEWQSGLTHICSVVVISCR